MTANYKLINSVNNQLTNIFILLVFVNKKKKQQSYKIVCFLLSTIKMSATKDPWSQERVCIGPLTTKANITDKMFAAYGKIFFYQHINFLQFYDLK